MFLTTTTSQGLRWTSNIFIYHQEGVTEVLPLCAQEVKPRSTAADQVLHRNNPVFSMHIHYHLVWVCQQTGQEQTATDYKDC